MKIVCSATSCKYSSENEDSSNIIFISFPNNDAAFLWALKCGREDLVVKPIEYLHKNQYICSGHLEDRYFISKTNPVIVASGAVPTLFEETIDSAAQDNFISNDYEIGKVGWSSDLVESAMSKDQISSSETIFNTDRSNVQGIIFEDSRRNDVIDNESFCDAASNLNELGGISVTFANLCRMCGGHILDGIDIFANRGLELRLQEKIRLHTPISFDADDTIMPDKICLQCCDKLEATHSLVLACLRTDLKLRKFINVESVPAYDPKYADLVTMCTMNPTSELHTDKINSRNGSTNNEYDDKWRNNASNVHHIDICRVAESDNDNISNMKYIANSDLNNFLETLDVASPKSSEKIDQSMGEINVIQEIKINSQLACTKCNDMFDILETLEKHICHAQEPTNHQQTVDLKTNMICLICDLTFVDEKLYEKHRSSCEDSPLKFNLPDSSEFSNKNNADTREISHSVTTNPRCGYCSSSFETRKELQSHMVERHNAQTLYKCGMCERTFEKWSSLDVHEATHRSDKPYLCDLCGKSFKHSNNLRGHKRIHLDESKKKRHVCDICGNAFRSRFHLREHMNQHNGNRPYKCEHCSKAFYKRIQLRQHRLSHSSNKYACPICAVTFNRRGNMNTHLKRHSKGEGTYTCSVCESKCKSMSELKMHRKQHSERDITESIRMKNANRTAYQCNICDKVFPKRAILSNHVATHSNERSLIECKRCGKKLANKSSLRYHERSLHSSERPHVCQYCGESFVSKGSRLIHERIHTGERPYACEICKMQYRCSSNLSQHMKIHSSLRPYVCQHCKKTFTRKGALNVHERIHSGSKPFNCELCDARFIQKNDMIKHTKTHRSKIIHCEKCNEDFEKKSEFLKHLNSHGKRSIDDSVVTEYAIASEQRNTDDIGINCSTLMQNSTVETVNCDKLIECISDSRN